MSTLTVILDGAVLPLDQKLANFSLRRIAMLLSFAEHVASATTAQLCRYSTEAAIDNV